MISDHLNDETTCKLVEANCDAKVMKGIAKIIEKYKDNLTKKGKEYLTSFSYNTSNLIFEIFVIFKKLVVRRKTSCNKVTYRDLQIQSNYPK